MNRYINGDTLADSIHESLCNELACAECSMLLEDGGCKVEKWLDDAPTIEPKRGEWAERTHNTLIAQVNFAYCSECGQPIMHEHTRPLWNFCPNCGAEMKGADDE